MGVTVLYSDRTRESRRPDCLSIFLTCRYVISIFPLLFVVIFWMFLLANIFCSKGNGRIWSVVRNMTQRLLSQPLILCGLFFLPALCPDLPEPETDSSSPSSSSPSLWLLDPSSSSSSSSSSEPDPEAGHSQKYLSEFLTLLFLHEQLNSVKTELDVGLFAKIPLKKTQLPIEDSAVLVFLSLSLMSWRSASRSLSSGFSSFTAAKKMKIRQHWRH